ncbi:3'-5' exonuclease [Limnobacter sp. 130]|uniref:3'-5' exonuclease n=1 Tax=unclassified Limnobacter TaxID=2630203 RepID=UPI0012EF68F3|nr:3'-5' exonuclease [Limnobacter sp. 130]VWX37094.1 DNA polymerase III subunit epsilon [Limnobacter sp. 130]
MMPLPKLTTYLKPGAQQSWRMPFEKAASLAQHPALKAFYSGLKLDEDLPLNGTPMLALDFETTGLNPEYDDIISIGAIPMDSKRILLGQSRYWVLKPAAKLRADTIPIHGITHSDIEQAPDLIDVFPDLLEMMTNRVVVAHCAGIESQFLSTALQYRIGEGISFPAFDTMGIERHFSNNQHLGLFARMFRKNQAGSLRLADVRSQYKLPFYRPHNALLDALACAELLQAQIQYHGLDARPVSQILPLR